jgi:transcriptional regulator with XRE-family HTH domain
MKIRKQQLAKNINPKASLIINIIARNVKLFRHDKLISQEYLAELSDLHRNYIGQIERSEVNISIITLEAIAKALDVKVIDLINTAD